MFVEILIVGIVLSADSFSAAVAMGHRPFTKKEAYRFAFSSGFAEGLCTYIGAIAGMFIVKHFAKVDHWIAFTLLMGVALHMVHESVEELRNKNEKSENERMEFHSFKKILLVSFATSLDALGVGIGLAVAHKPILPYTLSIGIWAIVSTFIGLHIGNKLSEKIGPAMGLVGATVLGYLAIKALEI